MTDPNATPEDVARMESLIADLRDQLAEVGKQAQSRLFSDADRQRFGDELHELGERIVKPLEHGALWAEKQRDLLEDDGEPFLAYNEEGKIIKVRPMSREAREKFAEEARRYNKPITLTDLTGDKEE